MRHSKRRHILGVSSSHRSAMLGNLSVALITHGRIKTTLAKAKALRPFIEKIITLAKKADQANDAARKLHFRRLAIARVRDKKAVAELFDNKVSEFSNRAGGYTRIYKLGQRVGDAAEMGLIELIDANDEGYPKRPKKKATKSETKAKAKAESEAEEVVEEVVEDAEQAEATEESSEAVEPEAEVAEADADAEEAEKKD
ncbi:MAG: 50S ribosomal protein L17 [Puniceicoccaceae bacterium]|nr:50S ribosomal protein L17 [Puniceicoccaceae bacterium]